MKQRNGLSYFFLVLAVSFWGLSFIFSKSLLAQVTPIALIFFRVTLASVLLGICCWLFFPQPLREITRKEWLNLLALSFFEPFLYFIFETYSLKVTDATIVSVIIATIPIFTVLMSVFYFKENLSAFNMFGVFLSVVGIVVMLLPEFSDVSFNPYGILLAFGAVAASVGYSYFIRTINDRFHSVFIVACQNVMGFFLFLPLFVVMHGVAGMRAQFAALALPGVALNIVLLTVFCSALAFVLYVIALQKVGLARSNIFTNLIPIVTAIAAYFVIDEKFTLYKILGTLVVIAGVFCVQRPTAPKSLN
ncbi:MAG: DMT family transporter [Bacteroidales bacterium]|nr:DMT family transporter [Bacteroidales bacterium]